ncbi:MAG: hypothetical protein NTY10_04725 [Candidatus Omnitrophica bacterium]|nr:hypothetical protein [Candidatus Omnitrophota bacterium]
MKRRILPLLFLVLSVIFAGGASLPLQSVMLNFAPLPENLLPLVDEKVTGELTDSPQKSLKGEPAYVSLPLYGAIVFGKGSGNRFIFSLSGNSLYFDFEQDGDLSNNQPLSSLPAIKGLFRKTLLSFPPVSVQVSYPDDVVQDYRLAVTCDLENKTFSFVNLGYRVGTIVFLPPEKNLKAAIYDTRPPNGNFNDFGKDFLLLDLNRDGEFDIGSDSSEKVRLAKTLSLAGDIYALEVMDSGEYFDIRQPSAGKQPAGIVAVRYITEKAATQSAELESGFLNGSFQVICSRGPAKFRKGNSCEVFVKNGELALYDSYNRPWIARFIGNPLTPAAVLTSFPSQFRIGFPLEQNLTTDKKEYRPEEKVVFSVQLVGQAKEIYTYFALGDASRQTQPPPKELNKLVFEESKPHLTIKDQAGQVVTEGDAVLKSPDGYQFDWQVPKETVIPDAGALYSAIFSWDTGSFQGVVSGSVQFSIVKGAAAQKPKGKK